MRDWQALELIHELLDEAAEELDYKDMVVLLGPRWEEVLERLENALEREKRYNA
jgi:hypothetical protein